jgi:Phospholipase_D-nuclease N-terminal
MLAQINIGTLIAQVSMACITLFWIWMMIDAATRQPSVSGKVLWFIGIFLLYFLGALVYFFVARKNKPRDVKIAVGVIVAAAIGALSWMLF